MKTHLVLPALLFVLLVFLSGCSLLTAEEAATAEPLPESDNDPCLQGTWVMSNEDVNSTMTALAPIPGLSIPSGTLTMAFTGNDFAYSSSDLTVRIYSSDGYMETDAAFLFTASFSTADGIINFANIVYDVETLVWRALIDGNVTEGPGPNTLLFPIPGNGPYGCSADALTFEVSGGAGPVILLFTRQP
jgi:hypothetical protein